jgi:DNA-damage-inducible protein J
MAEVRTGVANSDPLRILFFSDSNYLIITTPLIILIQNRIPGGILKIHLTKGKSHMSTKIQTSLRLDADKLAEAKQILSQLGLNFSEAVNIFTNLIVAKQGLPFDVALPNEKTKASMLDVRARKNLETITLEQLQREISTQ